MADLRITSGSPAQALTPVQPAARGEAIKAAQRAFFNAALTQAQASAPVRPRTDAPGSPSLQARMVDPSAPPPDRILRPGSLLDIKV